MGNVNRNQRTGAERNSEPDKGHPDQREDLHFFRAKNALVEDITADDIHKIERDRQDQCEPEHPFTAAHQRTNCLFHRLPPIASVKEEWLRTLSAGAAIPNAM
jgi:hypothetical protein